MTQSKINSQSTKDFVNRHLDNFGSGDIERIMTSYDAGSVLVTPNRVYQGLADIRSLFIELIDMFAGPSAEFELLSHVCSGNLSTIVWNAATETARFIRATDSFVVIDGKIANQTAIKFPDMS